MTSPSTILLIPKPEYAEALLREGPCGANPPMMGRVCSGHVSTVDGDPLTNWYSTEETLQFEDYTCQEVEGSALVLAWAGEPCSEGIDQFERFLNVLDLQAIQDSKVAFYVIQAQAAWWDGTRGPRMQPSMMDLYEHPMIRGIFRVFGSIIHLDSEGKEIAP